MENMTMNTLPMRTWGQPFRLRSVVALLMCGAAVAGCRRGAPPPSPTPEDESRPATGQAGRAMDGLLAYTTPLRIAEVRSQVEGRILEIHVAEGALVREGDILYRVDPARFEAALEEAEASLERAKTMVPALQATADRYDLALSKEIVSRREFDEAVAALKRAQNDVAFFDAVVEAARLNILRTRVVAPIGGRLGRCHVAVGTVVTPAQPAPLATIEQLDPIGVHAPVPAHTVRQLMTKREPGDSGPIGKVRLILPDGSMYPREGTLDLRGWTTGIATEPVTLCAEFPNPDGVLLPSMMVRMVVQGIPMDVRTADVRPPAPGTSGAPPGARARARTAPEDMPGGEECT
jgi:membrane fusion protein (multidrug efflux system)